MRLNQFCINASSEAVILRRPPQSFGGQEADLSAMSFGGRISGRRFFASLRMTGEGLRMTCISLVLFSFVSPAWAQKKLPIYGQVPAFTFTERSGREIKLADLKGSVWIADFIFTRCQGMCPMLAGRMAGLQEKLKDPKIKLVSFSVDPEHDTSQVLSEYASRYKAQESKWFFLTGSKDKMWNFITDGFLLGVEAATPEDLKAGAEPVMHSTRFVLVDQEGKICGYYDSSESVQMEKLVQDALSLASSLRGSDQGNAEAIHDLEIASLRSQ